MAKHHSAKSPKRKPSAKQINFEVLAVETIRALRGDRSQLQISRELGFSFNQIGKWESFEKRILWDDFVLLTKLKQAPLNKALLLLSLGYGGTKAGNILAELKADLSATEFARRLGFNRVQFSRWLNGTADVPLADMLSIFQHVRNGVAQFILRILAGTTIPSSLRDSLLPLKEYNIYAEVPWIGLITLAIDHKDCPEVHKAPQFLAKLLNFPVQKVQDALGKMLLLGILEIDSEKFYRVSSRISLSSHRPIGLASHRHWLKVASDAFEHLPEEERLSLTGRNLFTSLVIGVSPQTWSLIVERYRSFLETIRQLVMSDDDSKQSEYKILVFQAVDAILAGQVIDLSSERLPASKRQAEPEFPKNEKSRS